MKVIKATNAEMCCTMGAGTYRYRLGIPATAEASTCGGTGLHACEYAMDCLRYYSRGRGNRYFLATAEGDIAEDGQDTRISCTKLTLERELSARELAGQAMLYLVQHPRRAGWEFRDRMTEVALDSAEAWEPDGIAIARGADPRAKGVAGAHLGLLQEENGEITAARLLTVAGGHEPDVWYGLKDGKICRWEEKGGCEEG